MDVLGPFGCYINTFNDGLFVKNTQPGISLALNPMVSISRFTFEAASFKHRESEDRE
jgi:hypothetical protein